MRKLLALVLKELLIVVRDRTALLLFLAAPLGLTLVLAFASGGMAGGSDLSAIPVAVVNQDSGSVGAALVELLGSDELGGLIAATPASDSQAARDLVDRDEAAAAILIPPDLSSRATQTEGEPARIELYTNPGQPISSAVVQEVVQRFAQQVATGAVAAQVTVRQLLETGLVSADEAATVLPVAAERAAATAVAQQMVELATVSEQGAESGTVVYLAYYAPSFAILFLMFATASAAHTLLTEREAGTLDRLLATPTRSGVLLAGKMAGVLAIGLLQMAVLIVATRLLMGVHWGAPLPLALLVLLVVGACAALGLAITGLARDARQADVLSTTVVMVLAAVGGSFIPRQNYPAWLRTVSLIGPNAWGIEGFQKLAAGAALSELLPEYAALAVLAAVFFGLALWGARRLVR